MEQALHSQSDKSVAAAPYTITIQVMLKGVNDSQGNPYFQDSSAEVVCGMTSMISADKKIMEFFNWADFFTLAHEPRPVFFGDIRMLLRKIKKESTGSPRISDELGAGPLSTITI